jgi:hypothetical protein
MYVYICATFAFVLTDDACVVHVHVHRQDASVESRKLLTTATKVIIGCACCYSHGCIVFVMF